MRSAASVLVLAVVELSCSTSPPPLIDARHDAARDRSTTDRPSTGDLPGADLPGADRPVKKDVVAWPTCADGTLIGQCSTTRPYICNDQQKLAHMCSKCGCPGYETCNSAQGCDPTVAQLGPKADAYVDELQPAKNFGSAPALQLGRQWGTQGWIDSYLDFDLPPKLLQAGSLATVEKATLRLQLYGWGGWPVDFNVGLVSGTWSETVITYSNVPAAQSSVFDRQVTWGPNAIDVTELVKAWAVTPAAVHGLRLKTIPPSKPIPPPGDGGGYGYGATLGSRENADPAKRPVLEIVYR